MRASHTKNVKISNKNLLRILPSLKIKTINKEEQTSRVIINKRDLFHFHKEALIVNTKRESNNIS